MRVKDKFVSRFMSQWCQLIQQQLEDVLECGASQSATPAGKPEMSDVCLPLTKIHSNSVKYSSSMHFWNSTTKRLFHHEGTTLNTDVHTAEQKLEFWQYFR